VGEGNLANLARGDPPQKAVLWRQDVLLGSPRGVAKHGRRASLDSGRFVASLATQEAEDDGYSDKGRASPHHLVRRRQAADGSARERSPDACGRAAANRGGIFGDCEYEAAGRRCNTAPAAGDLLVEGLIFEPRTCPKGPWVSNAATWLGSPAARAYRHGGPLRRAQCIVARRRRSAARADDQVTEATGPHTRLLSMAFAFVTGWLLVWRSVAGAGTFSYLRLS
jgi:hypothetical protein